ncbi:monosaccharide-transporting ATPase [Clostridia bacterium]|nr:monosaccharide-transporting ATPase [Clostridia bacterium]
MMKNILKKILYMAFLPVVLFVFFTIATPGFGLHSLSVVLSQAMIPMMIGMGMSFSLTIGLFELSAGSQIILAGIVGALLSSQLGMWGLLIGCIASGILVGWGVGFVYTKLKIPSMVVSFGIVLILEVVGVFLTGRASYLRVDRSIATVASSPNNIIFVIITAVIFYAIYYHTRYGYQIKALGIKELAAINLGINAERAKFMSYVVAGGIFGVAAILQVCYSGAISTQMGLGSLSMVFQPMMGVMIGMELRNIYDNLAVNIFIGIFSISIIFNGLIAMGFPSEIQDFALGFFIITVLSVTRIRATITDEIRRRRRSGEIRKQLKISE